MLARLNIWDFQVSGRLAPGIIGLPLKVNICCFLLPCSAPTLYQHSHPLVSSQWSDSCSVSSWSESFFHLPAYQLFNSLTYSLFLSERPLSDLPNPFSSIFLLQMKKAIFLSFIFLLRHDRASDFVSFDISRSPSRFPFA